MKNGKKFKQESDQKLKCITEELEKFKNKLLLNKFDENQKHMNWFNGIQIYQYLSINRNFLVSGLISESLNQTLEGLLKSRELNGLKWSLLYRASRDGFRASDFHSRCDNRPNTITIVKSTSGNIFGGFTSAQWESNDHVLNAYEYDSSAFIFSLVNKENRPLIFEHSSSDTNSICSYMNYGPTFGGGEDIYIADNSNTKSSNFSILGKTYTHPEYPFGSKKAESILAGTHSFKVQEIEVFQMQQ